MTTAINPAKISRTGTHAHCPRRAGTGRSPAPGRPTPRSSSSAPRSSSSAASWSASTTTSPSASPASPAGPAILYLAAAFLILTQPVDRFTFPIILTVAIACRLAVLFAEPYLSSDIYRYVWDGIVQHAHISPYRYVPGNPVLAFLRAAQSGHLRQHQPPRLRPHHLPAGRAGSLLPHHLDLTHRHLHEDRDGPLRRRHHVRPRSRSCATSASVASRPSSTPGAPSLIWEIAGSGHLDSAAMAFIALALLARYRKQPILTGLFLAIAILLKLYPLILFPALYRRGDFKMPATVAAVIALAYAAYSSVGMLVFGFLGGYVERRGPGHRLPLLPPRTRPANPRSAQPHPHRLLHLLRRHLRRNRVVVLADRKPAGKRQAKSFSPTEIPPSSHPPSPSPPP